MSIIEDYENFLRNIIMVMPPYEKQKKESKPVKPPQPYLQVIMTGKEPKKNWENPKKVKFPAFCTYVINDERRLGQLNSHYENGKVVYTLYDVSRQWLINRVATLDDIERLIHYWKVEIVKVKIIATRG